MTEFVATRVVIYSISSQKWSVIVDGAFDVVPVFSDEAPVGPVVDGPEVVTAGPVGTDDGPVGPVVDTLEVVTPDPVGPDEAVGPVVDGPLVVVPDAVGPDDAPVASVVDGAFVVTTGPVVPADEDVVLPSAHAVTDKVTSVGPLLSLVSVTFIKILLTFSVGN
jgi:hypothetical protein